MARPHVQVILVDANVPHPLKSALERIDASATFWPLAEALRGEPVQRADAVVIVLPHAAADLRGPLKVLFDRFAEHPRAILVLTPDGQPHPHLPHPATVPVSFDGGLDEHDLAVRLTTLLEMRESLDSLHRGMLANRHSEQSVARRYMNQLRLASQVQRGFLPETLPDCGPVRFSVLFQPVDFVSGDIYDIQRLDEEHVGIALADASGHGIPAALLTVYIKRALRGKEIDGGTYRILSPDDVLRRLNEDILDAHLTECPFVATVYAVLNTRTLELTLARGGTPYPIYRNPAGELQLLHSAGSVVGVLPNATFDVCRVQLEPGSTALFFSDGLERIVAPRQTGGEMPRELRRTAERIAAWNVAGAEAAGRAIEHAAALEMGALAQVGATPAAGTATALEDAPSASAERSRVVSTLLVRVPPSGPHAAMPDLVTRSAWGNTLRREGTGAALEQLARRQRALRRVGYPLDDLTVIALQVAS